MKSHNYNIEKIKKHWIAFLYFSIAIFCWYYMPFYNNIESSTLPQNGQSILSSNTPQSNKEIQQSKQQQQKKQQQKQQKNKLANKKQQQKQQKNNLANKEKNKNNLAENNFIERELESLFNNHEENEWTAQGFMNKEAENANTSKKISKNYYQFQQKMNKFIEQTPINQNQQKKLHNYFLLVPPYKNTIYK